jgi:hypothetical protein
LAEQAPVVPKKLTENRAGPRQETRFQDVDDSNGNFNCLAPALSSVCQRASINAQKSLLLKTTSAGPAKRVVLSRYAGLGQRVEKGGLADVGQAHDAALEAHGRAFEGIRENPRF